MPNYLPEILKLLEAFLMALQSVTADRPMAEQHLLNAKTQLEEMNAKLAAPPPPLTVEKEE